MSFSHGSQGSYTWILQRMLAREISLVKKEKRYVLVSRSVVDMEEDVD